MGTQFYFEGTLKDQYQGGEVYFEAATSGFMGEGPQVLIKIDEKSFILDHETGKKLCNALGRIGGYLGYGSEGDV